MKYNQIIPKDYRSQVPKTRRLGFTVNHIPNPEPDKNVTKRWDLVDRFNYLAKQHLTWKQYEIFKLMLEGKSQTEIAKDLSLNQSSVNKTIFGNQVTVGKYKGKRHGGIIPKLKKYCKRDKIFVKLYKEAYGEDV